MGCGASKQEVTQPTSLGSWGVGGPTLANDVYGPKPRAVRSRAKLAELRQMLLYAEESQKPLPEEEHRRLMCGLAFFTERHSEALARVSRCQWALTVCSHLDTVVERELLQSDCFVALRDLARAVGMDLEWCEARWELDQERDANHSERAVRLRETRRAVQASVGPALIVVLGDKFGRPQLPGSIDAPTFEAILVELAKQGRTGERLANGYVKDTNTVPPVYKLQRIDNLLPDFLDALDSKRREQAEHTWRTEHVAPLLEDLKVALSAMQQQGSLSQAEADRYLQPTTMQDALQGVLHDAATGRGKKAIRTLLVNRCFTQINAGDPLATEYLDMKSNGVQDAQAAIALERLKSTLKAAIPPENVLDFSIPWAPEGLDVKMERHQVYLSQMGDKVTEVAAKVLADQLVQIPKLSNIEHEVHHHMRWLERNSTGMIGRPDSLRHVKDFLEQRFDREKSLFSFLPPKRPGCAMVITGAEGCGKSKLLCVAVAEVSRPLVEPDSSMGSMASGHNGEPTPIIIFRAIGNSHSLRTGRDVLRSMCLQLASVVQSTEPVPLDYSELSVRFGMLLAEAGESRRVLLILDGLDQLDSVADGSPCLHWLPVDSLPDNCFLLATVSSTDSACTNGQVYSELKERLTGDQEWLSLTALRPEETSALLQSWLEQDNRDLTSLQKAVLVGSASAALDGATATVLHLGYSMSQTWTSASSPPPANVAPCISSSANDVFLKLESSFTVHLVANVLGAMSISKVGLTRAEMLDVASMDDPMLKELFTWCVPPYARVPPSVVANLLHAVEHLIEERPVPGCAPVIQWKNASVRWHCKTRYDSAALRKRLCRYFSGSASLLFKPLTMKCRDVTAMLSCDRQIGTMPNAFWLGEGKARVNWRKMLELPPLLEGLKRWDELVGLLCDQTVFEALSSPSHVVEYSAAWKSIVSALGPEKGPDVVWEGFRGLVEKIEDYKIRAGAAQRVAKFLRDELGLLNISLKFLEGSLHALVHQGVESVVIADTLQDIAMIHYKARDFEPAVAKLDEVIAIRAQEFHPEHPKLTEPLKLSAEVMRAAGQIEEALRRYNDILRRLRGLERSEFRLLVAEITTKIADIHKQLGEQERAIACQEEALRIRKAVLEPDHLDVAINVNALAILYEKRGDLNNALSRFAEALQIRRSKLGPCHVDVASIYNNMAVVYESLGQNPEAILKYEQAVSVFRTKLGKNHTAVATILNNLGNVYKSQGIFAKSAESYEGALTIRRKANGKSLSVADTLNNLAGVLLLRGEYDRSLQCCQESLQIREELLGRGHIEVATMLNNIAGVRMKKGECDSTVEELCMEAYRIKAEQLGEDHVQVAEILNNIAMLRDMQGDNAKALQLTQQALGIQEQQCGKSHVSTAHSMHCKALFLRRQGDLEEAVNLCKEALKARKELLGEEHLDVANSLCTLSEIRLEQGAHEKALENCAQALSIRRSKLGPEHIDVATCLHLAGKIYLVLDRQDDTLQSYSEALTIRRKHLGNSHKDVAAVIKDMALIYWNRDMFEDALRQMEEAVDIYRRLKDERNKMELANTLNSLAALYWNQSEYDRAEEVTVESLEIRKEVLGEDHPQVAETLINLANVLESKGEAPKALERCKIALDIYVGRAGSDTVEVAQLHAQMGLLQRAMLKDDLAQIHLKRSVEIFEKILGTDHPETQDARDVLSTSTTPAATTVFGLEAQEENSAALDAGWAQKDEGVNDTPQPQPELKDAPAEVDAPLPPATAVDVTADAPQASQPDN